MSVYKNGFNHFISFNRKVVLDYHHRDMILINWAMSAILIGCLIFLNQPGMLKKTR